MERKNRCPGCKRVDCGGCGIYRKLNTNKQEGITFPSCFVPNPGRGLGISFDVGTTTLGAMLWDLESGALLAAEAEANPQAAFGADVVSRILCAQEEECLGKMQKLLVEKLDEMAYGMAAHLGEEWRARPGQGGGSQEEAAGAVGKHIGKAVLVGNTAMSEILLGIKPEGLGKAPFAPDYQETVSKKGSLLGFRFLGDTQMYVLPPIGGYVGGDALAVYHYVHSCEKGKKILAVDIGTNGEILLKWQGTAFACSAAAGPALEGGAVSWGMRAAKGAVYMVSPGGRFPVEDLAYRVSGGVPPQGICGSGLLDCLSLLLEKGIVARDGYLRSLREAREAGAPERMCRRIEEGEERRFLLTDEKHPVYLTAGDVRQLQLSVGAIRSAMEMLLQKAGLRADDLDGVYLAGAFGSYISVESAARVGLLPAVPREKICQAGNLAGTGAAMALLSERDLLEMATESRSIVHVELAQEEGFQELFLSHMGF